MCATTFSRRKASGGLYHAPRWANKVTCCNACHVRYSWSKRKESVEARFWRQVDKGAKTECWPWLGGARCSKGYGGFHVKGRKMVRAHRMAWQLSYGDIARTLVVRHRCDNPPCCNPHHLETGTVADNNRDRDARGRHVALQRGQHGCTKVFPEQLTQLLQRYAALDVGPKGNRKRGTVAALARDFNISVEHLCKLGKEACNAES